MQNKLQELTDKLYAEGLSKGKEEGARILDEARKNADAMIEQAKQKAAAILEKAAKDAEDLKAKVNSDINMASSQALQATKKDIENAVITKLSDEKVSEALKDGDFLKKIILAVAEKFNTEESSDLSIVLPESLKSSVEPFIQGELAKALGKNVEASFTKKIAGGFNIGPKDGGYFISLSDETFKSLISEYLRPVTRKFLFGE